MSVHRRKTKHGTVYMVRYQLEGRHSKSHVENFTDEAAARRRNREVMTALARGRLVGRTPPEVRAATVTFRELAESWWDSTSDRKPSTSATHSYQLTTWILPALGEHRLSNLTPGLIRSWRNEVRRSVHSRAVEAERRRTQKGKSPRASVPTGESTADRCLAIVKAIINHGIAEEILLRNPAAPVKLLRPVRSAAIDARSPEVVERIRRSMNSRDATLVSVLAYEGLRPSEAFALRWGDALDDLGAPRKRLLIRRGLSNGQLAETKNLRQRAPRLFAPVATDLRAWWIESGRPARSALVFQGESGGFIGANNWRRRSWHAALRRAEVDPFRPYDLRHTCATLLVYAGWNPLEVAAHLGHSDPGFTLRVYAHTFVDAVPEDRLPIEGQITEARRRHPVP